MSELFFSFLDFSQAQRILREVMIPGANLLIDYAEGGVVRRRNSICDFSPCSLIFLEQFRGAKQCSFKSGERLEYIDRSIKSEGKAQCNMSCDSPLFLSEVLLRKGTFRVSSNSSSLVYEGEEESSFSNSFHLSLSLDGRSRGERERTESTREYR